MSVVSYLPAPKLGHGGVELYDGEILGTVGRVVAVAPVTFGRTGQDDVVVVVDHGRGEGVIFVGSFL